MAYRIMDGPTSTTFVGTTQTTILTTNWISDPTAKYTLRWGGYFACPAAVGKLSIQVVFNGVTIAGPSPMQSPTDCWALFANTFGSDCSNQPSSNVNTLSVMAQVVGTGGSAKVKEGYLEFEQYG